MPALPTEEPIRSCRAGPALAPASITAQKTREGPSGWAAQALRARSKEGATLAQFCEKSARICGTPAVKNLLRETDYAALQGKRPCFPLLTMEVLYQLSYVGTAAGS